MVQLDLIIGPAVALGIIVGIYEAFLVHRDVKVPGHRVGHMIHSVILSVLFIISTMNAPYILKLLPIISRIPLLGNAFGIQIIIGLLAMFKVHKVSQAFKTSSASGETWFHSIVIGTLVTAAPYIYALIRPALQWLT